MLENLTDFERKFATENHNLIYDFLHKYGYSLENYYDVAVFGYLKAVQIYNCREDLRNAYAFPVISRQYMRAELGNYFKMENAKRRKPPEIVVSLDVEYSETKNLYNCIGASNGKFPETEVLEMERVMEFLNSLSDKQRKITEMKIYGYNSREIYQMLEMKSSTYYMEVKRIKKALTERIG